MIATMLNMLKSFRHGLSRKHGGRTVTYHQPSAPENTQGVPVEVMCHLITVPQVPKGGAIAGIAS